MRGGLLRPDQCLVSCVSISPQHEFDRKCLDREFPMDSLLFLLLLWSSLPSVYGFVSTSNLRFSSVTDPRRTAHLVGYNMQWASTIKEVELSHFFKEWPAMWKRFWFIWIVCWMFIAAMGIMSSSIVPSGFQMSVLNAIRRSTQAARSWLTIVVTILLQLCL